MNFLAMMKGLAVTAGLVLVALACGAVAQDNPLHVRLVDHGSFNSYLFRGPSPVNATATPPEFDFEWLKREMRARLARHNHVMPHEFRLVVVSLLTEETSTVEAERDYFEGKDDLFLEWPVYGINASFVQAACEANGVAPEDCPGVQPKAFEAGPLRKMSLAFEPLLDPDNLLQRVMMLRKFLRPQNHRANLVYFHSMDGSDRAGELASAYAMRYLQQTFTLAMEYDMQVPTPPRLIKYRHQTAVQWFCQYLEESGMYPHGDDCLRCDQFRC